MPTQQAVDDYLAGLRTERDTADTLYTNFDVEIRVYPTGAVQLYMQRPVLPGENAGTHDTVDEPETPTLDDYRLRDEELAQVAFEMREFGATVQTFARGDVAEIYASFPL